MLKNIVDYIITTSTQDTTSGNYCIYFEEITKAIPEATPEFLRANFEAIKDEIDTRPEILSETWEITEAGELVGFDINLALDYCPNYINEFEEI